MFFARTVIDNSVLCYDWAMNRKWQTHEPKKCWVGDEHKFCYDSQEEAEGAARIAETEHGLEPNTLSTYKCEYGEHWHLAHKR